MINCAIEATRTFENKQTKKVIVNKNNKIIFSNEFANEIAEKNFNVVEQHFANFLNEKFKTSDKKIKFKRFLTLSNVYANLYFN